jgi:hypothetical protein
MDDRTAAILGVIKELEPFSQRVRLRSPRGTSEREYRGVHFIDYARAAGLIGKNTQGAGLGDHYFVISATDDVCVVLAFAEIAPRFTDKRVMLAFEQDGEALNVGVRLVVPGDDLGGRSIMGVASISVATAGSAPSGGRTPGPVSVSGMVSKPYVLDAGGFAEADLIEVTTEPTPRAGGSMVPSRTYRGLRLWSVLERAQPIMDPAVNEDFVNKVIVARSSDGYATVIAGGEIEPRFMDAPVVLVPETDGTFRLVVPYDRAIGRNAKGITSIELAGTTAR